MNNKKVYLATWGVYILLLSVLLPHTAWAFSLFERSAWHGVLIAWLAAGAFEFAIAILTHRLSNHISEVPNSKKAGVRFRRRYMNVYALGLLVATGVSTLANLAHAVEFGNEMAIFTRYNVPFSVYAVAFGAILPSVSLLFARVLSNVNEAEQESNPELDRAKDTIKELRQQLREQGQLLTLAEQKAEMANRVMGIFAEDKAERILTARTIWPNVPQKVLAAVTETSDGYVSEVLNNGNGSKPK